MIENRTVRIDSVTSYDVNGKVFCYRVNGVIREGISLDHFQAYGCVKVRQALMPKFYVIYRIP